MTLSLRGLGVCSDYPDSISFGQAVECAFNPWSDTCKKLKEQADLECAVYTGAIQQPPMPAPPGVPDEGLTPGLSTRTPQEIQDETIARSYDEYQRRYAAFINAQAAAAEAAAKVDQQKCGMFTSFNAQAGECQLDLTRPAFLILGALAALMAFGGRR